MKQKADSPGSFFVSERLTEAFLWVLQTFHFPMMNMSCESSFMISNLSIISFCVFVALDAGDIEILKTYVSTCQ